MQQLKQCTRCKDLKLATAENFVRKSRSKDGLSSQCRECYNAANRESKVRLAATKPKRDPLLSRGLANSPSLAVSHPDLASQWDKVRNAPLTPNHVIAGSHNRIWWRCTSAPNHFWDAVIRDRVKHPDCPFCSGIRASAENNLEVRFPDISKEWHPDKNKGLKPTEVTYGSNKKVWWKCSKGHEWEAVIGNRVNGRGCPICANREIGADNSLAVTNPDVAAEWHPKKNKKLTPSDVVPGGHQKVWWQCRKNATHVWLAKVSHRVGLSSGCPYCNDGSATSITELRIYAEMTYLFGLAEFRKKVSGVECDVFIPELNIAFEIDGAYWHEKKEHKDRQKNQNHTGCPICAGRSVLPDRNLEAAYPDIAKEWHPTKNYDQHPAEFSPRSSQRVWWQCKYGHEWESIIGNRTRLGRGCPYCAGQRATDSDNLLTNNPKLAAEWHPTKNGELRPEMFKPNSHKKVWWVCSNIANHEWEASISDRNRGTACPVCRTKTR